MAGPLIDFSYSHLFVSEDKQRWRDAIASNQKTKSLIYSTWREERSTGIALPHEEQAFLPPFLNSELRCTFIFMCSNSTFLLCTLVFNAMSGQLTRNLCVLFITMILEIQLIMALSSWCSESYGNQPLCHVTFVGGGYNRVLLAFNSLLCGQTHLNVSTASWLFRNRLEIGNTNASVAPITRRLALYLTVYTGLQ